MKSKTKRAKEIILRLIREYPNTKCSLNYKSPFQLLVATILSAQCTDKRVNKVARNLFSKYPKVENYIELKQSILEKIIYSTGFYKNKSKSILSLSKVLYFNYDSIIPQEINELIKLPGVGRKTANVVLGIEFNFPALVVDTHVTRISNLLSITNSNNAIIIEKDLMKIFNKKYWIKIALLFIDHGRAICIARRPKCNLCVLSDLCPSFNNN